MTPASTHDTHPAAATTAKPPTALRPGGETAGHGRIDPTVAHPARVYDYWLGGHFP